MQFWSDASTVFGGRSPQTSSISRSVDTTSFGMQQKQREDAALLLAPERQRVGRPTAPRVARGAGIPWLRERNTAALAICGRAGSSTGQ